MKLFEIRKAKLYRGIDLYILGMWIAVLTASGQFGFNLGNGTALYRLPRHGFRLIPVSVKYAYRDKA